MLRIFVFVIIGADDDDDAYMCELCWVHNVEQNFSVLLLLWLL